MRQSLGARSRPVALTVFVCVRNGRARWFFLLWSELYTASSALIESLARAKFWLKD